MKLPGILIALEGIDGSGKSTLAHNLATLLKNHGHDVLSTKEPGGSQLGLSLRRILQDQPVPITPVAEYLLFAADRAQHITDVVKPALEKGMIVISDRMADSSLVYQGFGRGIDMHMIHTINAWVMQNIKPDITIYVSIDHATAMHRVIQRKNISAFEKEQESFIQRLIDGFETLYTNRTDVLKLSGKDTPDHIAHQALQGITQWIQHHQ